VAEDNLAGWNAGIKCWVAPTAGTYLVTMGVKNGATAVTSQYLTVDNGTSTALIQSPMLPALAFGGGQVTRYLRLAAGDAVRAYAAVNYTSNDASCTQNFLEIVQVAF